MRALVLAFILMLALPLFAAADVLPGPGPGRPFPPPPPPRPRAHVSYVEQETDWNGLMGAGVFVVVVALVVMDGRRRRNGDIEL